jgi:hypothetical protein
VRSLGLVTAWAYLRFVQRQGLAHGDHSDQFSLTAMLPGPLQYALKSFPQSLPSQR